MIASQTVTDARLTWSVFVPLRTKRGENNRESWRARWARGKREKEVVLLMLNARYRKIPKFGSAEITLLRSKPSGDFLDDDNLRGALKYPRDAVARYLKLDDADPRLRFDYAQTIGPWGVLIAIYLHAEGQR